jgi:hypothetical protein
MNPTGPSFALALLAAASLATGLQPPAQAGPQAVQANISSSRSGAVGRHAKTTNDRGATNETKTTCLASPRSLPILGAGVSFRHSRRLKKRLQSGPSA